MAWKSANFISVAQPKTVQIKHKFEGKMLQAGDALVGQNFFGP
jgi:hypothetical protein